MSFGLEDLIRIYFDEPRVMKGWLILCYLDFRTKFGAIQRDFSVAPRELYVHLTSVTDTRATSAIIHNGASSGSTARNFTNEVLSSPGHYLATESEKLKPHVMNRPQDLLLSISCLC